MCMFLAGPLPLVDSHKALIQFPSANKLLLIFAPSTNLIPLLLVLDARSEPAKSISDSLAMLISALMPWALSLCSTVTYSTAWERDDASLASVRSLVRALFPYRMYRMISSVLVVIISITPATHIPLTASSLSSKLSLLSFKRSFMSSL